MGNGKLAFRLETSKPCSERWEEMQGSARQRHCGSCDQRVHNLAEMTASEINSLVRESKGLLCARIMRRPDGSVVTHDPLRTPNAGAGLVLSASILLANAAVSTAVAEPPQSAKASLAGKVLVPDGSAPVAGAVITLRSSGATIAEVKSDKQGDFLISVAPGKYDIYIRQNAMFGLRILAAELHEGEQSLQPVRTHFAMRSEQEGSYPETATVGELVATYKYPISYLLRHPWQYLRNLPHNF